MQGLFVLAFIVWFIARAGKKNNRARRRSPQRMRNVSTLTQARPAREKTSAHASADYDAIAEKIERAAQKLREAGAVSNARPAREKTKPCRVCETEFGYQPVKERASEPRLSVELRPPDADEPCDACETNFGYRFSEEPQRAPEPDEAPPPTPGFLPAFDRNAILQGVVYSEILGKRPHARRNAWNPYAR